MDKEKYPWELEVEEALKTGNGSHFNADVIKLIIANQAIHEDTAGARTAAGKTLAQTQAMLVQVTKDATHDQSDEQVAESIAKDLSDLYGLDPEQVKKDYLAKVGKGKA